METILSSSVIIEALKKAGWFVNDSGRIEHFDYYDTHGTWEEATVFCIERTA